MDQIDLDFNTKPWKDLSLPEIPVFRNQIKRFFEVDEDLREFKSRHLTTPKSNTRDLAHKSKTRGYVFNYEQSTSNSWQENHKHTMQSYEDSGARILKEHKDHLTRTAIFSWDVHPDK